jgi:hypothetical protein
MIRFIAANALAVCSISTVVRRLETIRSIYCTMRVSLVGQSLPWLSRRGDIRKAELASATGCVEA